MKTATVSEFRANMKEHLNEIEKDQDVLILSGPKKKNFVLITLEAYNSIQETAHLLSTPANTSRLMEGIAQDKAGQIARKIEIAEEHARDVYVEAKSERGEHKRVMGRHRKISKLKSGTRKRS